MKYTKPATRNSVVLLNFLDSLPAEFEIVEPGMTQVRWPEGFTRERLESLSRSLNTSDRDHALRALAAIAPVEKKKEKKIMKMLVTLDFGTHKVGPFESECEVDE